MPVGGRSGVTIADVARHLGVAKGTVSRALNGYPDIAEVTRERVVAAAEHLGYRASSSARRLKRGRADTIGVVLPVDRGSLADPFLAAFLDGASRQLEGAGLDLLLVAAPTGADPLEPYRRLLATRKVDGFLVTRTAVRDDRIALLREVGVPFVSHGRTGNANVHAWLDMDNAWATVEAVRHLHDLGHRRIAYAGGPLHLNFARERLAGYRRGLVEQGLARDPALLVGDCADAAHGLEAAARLLALAEPPTAVVAVTDAVAAGVLRALRRQGLRAGADVSVVGYDDVPLAAYTDPPLTTFTQDSTAAGAQAARMLVELMQGRPPAELQTLLLPVLVNRCSTGAPARSPMALRRRLDRQAGPTTTQQEEATCPTSDAA